MLSCRFPIFAIIRPLICYKFVTQQCKKKKKKPQALPHVPVSHHMIQ